jgi:hypothetical protein
MDGLNERQHLVARQLARGFSRRYINTTTGISRDTIRRWEQDPFFASEVERLREQTKNSTSLGVIVDALGARRDDNIDWPSRIRAAIVLLEIERDPSGNTSDDRDVGGWV